MESSKAQLESRTHELDKMQSLLRTKDELLKDVQRKADEEHFLLVLSHKENNDLRTKNLSLESIIKKAQELPTKNNFLESTGNEK